MRLINELIKTVSLLKVIVGDYRFKVEEHDSYGRSTNKYVTDPSLFSQNLVD